MVLVRIEIAKGTQPPENLVMIYWYHVITLLVTRKSYFIG